MDFNIISTGLEKSWDVFKNNAVAYIVGLLIAAIGSCFTFGILSAPLWYGFGYMAIKGSRGEKVEIGDVFYGLRTFREFIRSWVYCIVPALIFLLVGLIAAFIIIVSTYYLATISSGIAIASIFFYFICFLICALLSIILVPIFFNAIYIYIMSPSENLMYAYRESFNVLKANIPMTVAAILVVYILNAIGSFLCGIGLLITTPIAVIFTVSVLKAIRPDLIDNAE